MNCREKPPARVVRTAGALDENSRTLRTEVLVPNQDGKLVPGLYTEVTLHVERASRRFASRQSRSFWVPRRAGRGAG